MDEHTLNLLRRSGLRKVLSHHRLMPAYIPLYTPLAWVLVGGLSSSLLLSRIVTPVLYKLLLPEVAVAQPAAPALETVSA